MAVPKERLTLSPAQVSGGVRPEHAAILTPEALAFLAELHRQFDGRRLELLAAREARQARYDAGELPDFRTDTAAIREGNWTVAPRAESSRAISG